MRKSSIGLYVLVCSHLTGCYQFITDDPVRVLISVTTSPNEKIDIWLYEVARGATAGPFYEICYTSDTDKKPILLGVISDAVLSRSSDRSAYGVVPHWVDHHNVELQYLKSDSADFESYVIVKNEETYQIKLASGINKPADWSGYMMNIFNDQELEKAKNDGRTSCVINDASS